MHWHHIVPRHAGGTDDPNNLVQLTIEEHAQAHKELFDTYGRWQDKVAWQMLSGRILPEEARIESAKKGYQDWLQDEDNRESSRIVAVRGGKSTAAIRREAGTLDSTMQHARDTYFTDEAKFLAHQMSSAKKAGEKLSIEVETDKGVFRNVGEAAIAHGIKHKTAEARIRRGTLGWKQLRILRPL